MRKKIDEKKSSSVKKDTLTNPFWVCNLFLKEKDLKN
jgi:hypothetical protein